MCHIIATYDYRYSDVIQEPFHDVSAWDFSKPYSSCLTPARNLGEWAFPGWADQDFVFLTDSITVHLSCSLQLAYPKAIGYDGKKHRILADGNLARRLHKMIPDPDREQTLAYFYRTPVLRYKNGYCLFVAIDSNVNNVGMEAVLSLIANRVLSIKSSLQGIEDNELMPTEIQILVDIRETVSSMTIELDRAIAKTTGSLARRVVGANYEQGIGKVVGMRVVISSESKNDDDDDLIEE